METKEFRASEGLPEYVAKKRKCLKCEDFFESEWKGNRICSPCKETIDYGLDSYSFDGAIEFNYDLSINDIVENQNITSSYTKDYQEKDFYDN